MTLSPMRFYNILKLEAKNMKDDNIFKYLITLFKVLGWEELEEASRLLTFFMLNSSEHEISTYHEN